jgi:hypothetical protein
LILIGQLEAERPAAGNPEFDPAPGDQITQQAGINLL